MEYWPHRIRCWARRNRSNNDRSLGLCLRTLRRYLVPTSRIRSPNTRCRRFIGFVASERRGEHGERHKATRRRKKYAARGGGHGQEKQGAAKIGAKIGRREKERREKTYCIADTTPLSSERDKEKLEKSTTSRSSPNGPVLILMLGSERGFDASQPRLAPSKVGTAGLRKWEDLDERSGAVFENRDQLVRN